MFTQNINNESNFIMSSCLSHAISAGERHGKVDLDRKNRPSRMSLAEIRKLIDEVMG
ncbi:MAG TPA: hypothetical protein VMH92_13630 [Acidocella sp.]|nr:hypothetical protein [Acidocella sp.]